MVKFGIQHPNFTYDGVGHEIFQSVKKQALIAETSGVDSFWVMDHFHQIHYQGKPEEPMLEGWAILAALSSVTNRIRLGTLVTGNFYRNPAILAKMGATVDAISNGRLFMGIGAGWYEAEAQAYGIPIYTAAQRLNMLGEALQIIKGMWTKPSFTFQGKHYFVKDALCEPKPVQKPHPPILVGGGGEKVTLKLVAKHGDACNVFGGPQTIKDKYEKLREHCRTVGRNYDEILKTRTGTLLIGSDENEVSQLVKKYRGPAQTEEAFNEAMTYGTPERVIEKILELIDAGAQYLIFNLAARDSEKVLRLFVEKVIPKVST